MAKPRLQPSVANPGVIEGKYIDFWPSLNSAEGKPYWIVREKLGGALGEIAWYPRWRKFCFYPGRQTGFEEVCLADISEFIVERTKEAKARTAA